MMSIDETHVMVDEARYEGGGETLWSFWRNFVLINMFLAFSVVISMFFDVRVYRIACSVHMLFFTVYLMYMYKKLIGEEIDRIELDRQRVCVKV